MCVMGKKQIFIIWHDFKPVTNQNSHEDSNVWANLLMDGRYKSQLVGFSMVYWNWSWVLPRSIPNGLIFL